MPGLSAATAFGLFVAICVSQTGSLFSADAWNNITFTAGEVKDPRRNIPLSLALGTVIVIGLYLLANVAYLVTLPFEAGAARAGRPRGDRDAERDLPGRRRDDHGRRDHDLDLRLQQRPDPRRRPRLLRDGARRPVLPAAGELNAAKVPAWGLVLQGVWAALLVLPRTYNPATGAYGNLYSNLLDYVISAALIFYILTIAGVFRLRRDASARRAAVPGVRLPGRPGALHSSAPRRSSLVLFIYRPATTWPGLVIVLLGVPVYLAWRRGARWALAADGELHRTSDHVERLRGQLEAGEVGCARPSRIGRIRVRVEVAADHGAQVVDEDVVILDASFDIQVDAIEHLDDRSDLHHETCFLEHLALKRRAERLAEFDGAARQAPLAHQRRTRTLHQQHATVVDDDGADADHRPAWEHPIAHTPNAFTTTRFRR